MGGSPTGARRLGSWPHFSREDSDISQGPRASGQPVNGHVPPSMSSSLPLLRPVRLAWSSEQKEMTMGMSTSLIPIPQEPKAGGGEWPPCGPRTITGLGFGTPEWNQGSPVGDPCFDCGSTCAPLDLKESVFAPCCFSSSPRGCRGTQPQPQ